MSTIESVIKLLNSRRLDLQDEKQLQRQLNVILSANNFKVEPEFRLDPNNIIDFLVDGNIGIEVKIKGGKKQIYKQVERYSYFNTIQTLILVTNRSMGFPQQMNGKPCFVVNLGKAWL